MWASPFWCSRSRERTGNFLVTPITTQFLPRNVIIPRILCPPESHKHFFVSRCDVFTAVRKLRAQRQGMIQELVSRQSFETGIIFSQTHTRMEDQFFSFSKKVIFSWKNLVRRKSEKHKLCHGGRGRSCGNQIPWLEIPREKPETIEGTQIFVLRVCNANHFRLSLLQLFHWIKLQKFPC